jgi:hypothetical protein
VPLSNLKKHAYNSLEFARTKGNEGVDFVTETRCEWNFDPPPQSGVIPMDDGQEPKVLDVMVSLMSSLLRSGSNHGVNAGNIDEVMEKVGRVAGKFTSPAPAPGTTPAATEQSQPSTTPSPAAPVAKAAEAPAAVAAPVTEKTAPATAKVSPKVTAKAKTAAPAAKARGNKPTPAVTAPAPIAAKTETPAPVDQPMQEAKPKRGRKPKAVATPESSEPVAAAQPEVRRGPGRPKKVKTEVVTPSQTTLFNEAGSGEISDDPKSPNYRFRNLMKNGKPSFFKGMKLSNAINGEEVTCMICGVHQMMLKKHLTTKHNMTGDQYLRFIGVDPEAEASKDYLRGPGFAERKSAETKASGFGKHDRLKKTEVVAVKATAASKKATPAPTAETKKTKGRAKVTA